MNPGSIDGTQAPHINICAFARGLLSHAYTRIYFSDETAANAADPVLQIVPDDRRPTLIAHRDDTSDSIRYRFDIRMQDADETLFFDVRVCLPIESVKIPTRICPVGVRSAHSVHRNGASALPLAPDIAQRRVSFRVGPTTAASRCSMLRSRHQCPIHKSGHGLRSGWCVAPTTRGPQVGHQQLFGFLAGCRPD